MTRWSLVFFLVLASGCVGARPVVVQPVRPVEHISIKLNPQIVLSGGATWLSCRVPDSIPEGRMRMSLEGIVASEDSIGPPQVRRLVERLPCGTWVASCEVVTRTVRQRVETTLTVLGECHE